MNEKIAMVNEENERCKFDTSQKAADDKKNIMKFIILSTLGIVLFLYPIKYGNGYTIVINLISNTVRDFLKPVLVPASVSIIYFATIGALIEKFFKPKWIENFQILKQTLDIGWGWIVVRVIAVVIATMTLLQKGPAFVISGDTAGHILNKTVPNSVVMLAVCGFVLPLLLEFGLMEYCGVMAQKFFRKVFQVPGAAAVDCITSWLGNSNVAVVLTDMQFVRGRYTEKESASIMTCFSAGSIVSVLVFLSYCDLEDMFFPFYIMVCILGIICAYICPRIPPLRMKNDKYYNGINNSEPDDLPECYTRHKWALELAARKARDSYSFKGFIVDGATTAFRIVINVAPSLLTIAAVALMIANHTTIFQILGTPFTPLFQLFGFEEAKVAASTLMGGFADNYIPCILAGDLIQSKMLKMVIVLTAYNGLIYMSSMGALIVQSETPVSALDCFIIFLERTVLSIILGSTLCILLSRLGILTF